MQVTAKAVVNGTLGFVAIGEPHISLEECEHLPATSKRGKGLVVRHIYAWEKNPDLDVLLIRSMERHPHKDEWIHYFPILPGELAR